VANLSDTAFLAAYYRAQESNHPDAIVDDPFAHTLSGERGASSAAAIPYATAGYGCALRTWLIDKLIIEFLQSESVDAVLNLGAGLDARPYRLSLPSRLKWIEVDDGVMLDYKRERLAHAPVKCRLSRRVDFVTDDWSIDRLLESELDPGERCLVLTEGLLIYLDERTVRHLAQELRASGHVSGWITDLASPLALSLMDKLESFAPKQHRPEWRFAPSDGAQFFENLGWRVASDSSCVDAGYRLQRELYPQSMLVQLPKAEKRLLRQLSHVALLLPGRETVSVTKCLAQA